MRTIRTATLLLAAGVLVSACGGDGAGVTAEKSSIVYQYRFTASDATKGFLPNAATWGAAYTGPFKDSTVTVTSDMTNFDLLDASSHVLYSCVMVAPDLSANIDQNKVESYLQWGITKTGTGRLDPSSDEAQKVFMSFLNDTTGATP